MEAVKRAASGAVESIKNSPLFRRKFGTYQKADDRDSSDDEEEGTPISPAQDRTPFVQGIYFHMQYLGRQEVPAARAQDHGVTDEAVTLLWGRGEGEDPTFIVKRVSVRVMTTSLRVKQVAGGEVLFDSPLFRVSYCGTDKHHKEAFCFVAKEDDGKFYCFVFRCASKEKAYAAALTLSKAFYLAYQIFQEEQGQFPATPERETLFEPQLPTDTRTHPPRPTVPTTAPTHSTLSLSHEDQESGFKADLLEFTDSETGSPSPSQQAATPATPPPAVRVTRPSQASTTSSDSLLPAMDNDFTRLAKARSNPNILRSTLDHDITDTGGIMALVRLHMDAGSQLTTPIGSPGGSPFGSKEDLVNAP